MSAVEQPQFAKGFLPAYGRAIGGILQLVGFKPSYGPDYGRMYLKLAVGIIPPIMAILLFRKYVLKGRKK